MSTIECDVLVVGGGPAGSSAARAAAKKGLKTILIDKKEEIGKPVQCAEGIGSYLFPFMPFEIPKEQLIWKTEGMYFWADDIAIKEEGDKWSGYSINRANWDKWTFWRKLTHVLAVIASLISVIIMFLIAAYVVLFIFGLHGFILHIRDTILLDIMHSIFRWEVFLWSTTRS